MWISPPVRHQTIHVSGVPMHRSRPRSGSTDVPDVGGLGRRLVRGEPVALRLQREAVTEGAQILPSERRSDGPPVARSHTTVDARWQEIPRASAGPVAASTVRAKRIERSA